MEDLKDILTTGIVHKKSKTVRAADSVFKEFEVLKEEFLELQKKQKTVLLKMGEILSEFDYQARKGR